MRSGLSVFVVLGIVAALALPPVISAEDANWRQRPSVGEGVSTDDISAEIDFGREVSARILGRYKLYENAALTRYVNLVGLSLVQNTNRQELDFHFAILDTDEINAYAAPGGYIFITKNALALVKDEAELAGVLAHEINHVTGKHVVKELNIRGTEDSPVSGFAQLIGGSSESARLAFAQAVDKALDMLFKNGYKREDEVQADRGAVLLCALSGYDPSGLGRYLERIAAAKGKKTEVIDKTHPAIDARVALIKSTMTGEGIDGKTLKTNKERFAEAIKAIK